MSTSLSATNPSAGELIRRNLDRFRLESEEWEAEVETLFDDIDQFLDVAAPDGSPTLVDSASVTDDLAGLKCLVEQQTDVLTALVNALTGPPAAPAPTAATDDVIDSVLGQFEQLQQAE